MLLASMLLPHSPWHPAAFATSHANTAMSLGSLGSDASLQED
jgi:hypothetical protein